MPATLGVDALQLQSTATADGLPTADASTDHGVLPTITGTGAAVAVAADGAAACASRGGAVEAGMGGSPLRDQLMTNREPRGVSPRPFGFPRGAPAPAPPPVYATPRTNHAQPPNPRLRHDVPLHVMFRASHGQALETLHVMSLAASAARHTIDATLDLERIDAGEVTVVCRPASLRACLRELHVASAPLARAAGVELTLALPSVEEAVGLGLPSDALSLFDVAKVSQIVRNLVSNALKFTRRGGTVQVREAVEGVTVHPSPEPMRPSEWTDDSDRVAALAIAARRGTSRTVQLTDAACERYFHITRGVHGARYVMAAAPSLVMTEMVVHKAITVADSGCGLTREDLGRLFQPFTQVASGSKEKGGGTGLGLYLSKRMAEAHGGTLTAESEGPGRGATFTLRLPLRVYLPPGSPAPTPLPLSRGVGAPPPLGDAEGDASVGADNDERSAGVTRAAATTASLHGGTQPSMVAVNGRADVSAADGSGSAADAVSGHAVRGRGDSEENSLAIARLARSARRAWADGQQSTPSASDASGDSDVPAPAPQTRWQWFNDTSTPGLPREQAAAAARSPLSPGEAAASLASGTSGSPTLAERAAPGAASAVQGSSTSSGTGGGSSSSGGALRFLVVDDVSSNRLMLRRMLQRLFKGCTVAEAEDGQEGVAAVGAAEAAGAPFHVLLVDGYMPVCDGYDATRTLRQQMGYSGVIIGVTGNALDADRAAFMEAGADSVHVKPVSSSDLAAEIRRRTAGIRTAAAAPGRGRGTVAMAK